jgi:hypothetical protein
MESEDEPIDIEAELMRQPLWFRCLWRFSEWRRRRYLARIAANH